MSQVLLYVGILFAQLILLFFISRITINELFRLFHKLFQGSSLTYGLIALIFFPGTVIHELAHFFAAIIMLLRVREIHLLPEWDNNSIKLGHVLYEKQDVIRGILVGIAPLPAGLLVLWAMYAWNVFPGTNWGLNILLGYIIFSISTTMFSSKQDLIDLAYIIPLLLVLAIPVYIFHESLFSLVTFVSGELEGYAQGIADFFKAVNWYVFFSLLIHLGLIGLLKIPHMFVKKQHHHYR